jgi:hypothetical protein
MIVRGYKIQYQINVWSTQQTVICLQLFQFVDLMLLNWLGMDTIGRKWCYLL